MTLISYAGYEEEQDGTYLAGCRYYDPELGRFLSRDRLGGNILDIQSLNTYAYVKNNPLTYKDPDGLSPVSTAYTPYLTGEAPPTNTIPYAASWQGGNGQTSGGSGSCIREKGYLERSVEQIVLGNFTDEVTLLGTAGQVALGVVGFDLPGDIRDIIADFANWEWSWWHVGQTLVDIVGVLPLVGVIKYADEVGVLIKNGFKKLGNILETAKDAVKAWET